MEFCHLSSLFAILFLDLTTLAGASDIVQCLLDITKNAEILEYNNLYFRFTDKDSIVIG